MRRQIGIFRPVSGLLGASRLEDETIPRPADRLKEARFFRLVLDFFTHASNVDIHRTRRHEAVTTPDFVEQTLAAVRRARIEWYAEQVEPDLTCRLELTCRGERDEERRPAAGRIDLPS